MCISGGYWRCGFNIFGWGRHASDQCVSSSAHPFCGAGVDSWVKSRDRACSLIDCHKDGNSKGQDEKGKISLNFPSLGIAGGSN